jgi:hypothetical protein
VSERESHARIAASVLAAGVALSLPGCGTTPAAPATPTPTASAPVPATSTTPPASPPDTGTSGDPFAGDRQVAIRMHAGPGAVLTIDAKGRLVGTDAVTERGLFVLVPVGRKYQIRTAARYGSGEPSCLGTKFNGTAGPDTIVAAVCDTRANGQLFIFKQQRDRTYEMSVTDDGVIQFNEKSGIFAQPLGDSTLDTTFSFIDRGPARPYGT